MSYTVLARRYRSATFDEVVGQSHVAQTLKKAIESERIAHAYLFCGTRGTGKTSMARILAKALNCHKYDKPTPTPCGKCESCKKIATGDDIDVIEIDAASNTGVDNVREVIENSQYRPAVSRFKIYIIDEAHMLSKQAFNALLKTLEEPPDHVKFILATTEPEKVLATILSRCQRYDFRNIPTREIANHLASICKKEKIDADADALFLVAKAGAGSMRDALSLLDRVLSLGEKKVTLELIEELLGLPKSQLMFDIAQAIGSGNVKSCLQQAEAMISGGLSVDSLLVSLVDHLRNLLILNTCGADSDLVEVPGLPPKDLAKQAVEFDAVELSQDIAILEELRRQVRQSQAGRALLDATLVRMAMAGQFASVASLLNRLDGAPAGADQKKKFEPVVSDSGPLPNPPPEYRERENTEEDSDALPAVGKVWEEETPRKSLATIMAEAKRSQPAAEAPVPSADPSDPESIKRALLAVLKSNQAISGVLIQGQFAGIDDGRMVIRFPTQDTFVKMLERNGKRELVIDALSRVLDQPTGVRFEIDESLPEPAPAKPMNGVPRPAPRGAPSGESAPPPPPTPSIRLTPELRAEIEAVSLVRAIMETLGGTVVRVE